MESQQIMELLLAMNEKMTTKEHRKSDREKMKAMQERAEAERISDREEIIARMDANTKAKLATQVKMNETKEAMKTMQENIQENIKKTMEEILSEMEERMTATQGKTDGKLKELTETIEKTLAEPREEMMQSAEEHREVPREDATVIPVRGRKRWHRGRKQAAGRHGEPKELTRGDHGSRKMLAAACRKASRRAAVAWRKRNVFRKF
jgi:ElaB/YqjD/DUF883 family membrane-anchored ribosome-binding protein